MSSSASLLLLSALVAVVSCHIVTHQKKNVATSQDQLQLTTSRVEQQSSSVVANQPFKMHPSEITTIFGAKAPQDIICPDGHSTCPSDNTCCLNQSGGYGCCSFPDAICCSDREHCCHLGYSCNSDGTCTQQHVICPDKSYCPLKNTCCLLPSGEYSCCPTPYGSCCADGQHCCDLGYSCNSDDTCQKISVVCPDQSTCPLNNTCCLLNSGDYGCCPLPNAVCCSNEKCCPFGNTCNSDGTCSHLEEHLPSAKQPTKESARPTIDAIFVKSIVAILMKQSAIIKAPQNNVCPDGSECASNNTCCENSSGGYGCCPLQNAACCSDGQHCCPIGYTCDVGANSCTRVNVVCPDQNSLCPLDTTCCLHASGEYGCCPGLNAVCCSDGEHCCPEGYTCDLSAGKCIQQKATTSKAVPSPCTDGGMCRNHGDQQPAIKLSGKVRNVKPDDFL